MAASLIYIGGPGILVCSDGRVHGEVVSEYHWESGSSPDRTHIGHSGGEE